MTSEAAEAVELAESVGLVLDPWQRTCLEVALGVRSDGKWAALQVCLIVSRQNGKGAVLEALQLAALLLWGEKLILHSAHEFKTASESFRKMLSLVENSDWLGRQFKKPKVSHGEEGLETLDGRRLRFVARSTGSGRGFSGDRVILDEAYALTDAHMAALMPTMSAKSVTGNPQIWYTSSAPLETSVVLQRLRRMGRAGDPALAYLEWSAAEDASTDDPEALRQANPALGIRIDDEFVAAERAVMDEAQFRRERLGISPDILVERFLKLEEWNAICDPDVTPGSDIAFGVDVSPEREKGRSTIVACDPAGNIEVVDSREGVHWLFDRVVELARTHRATVTVDSASPAASLADGWDRAGVLVDMLTARQMAGACGTFYDAVLNRTIRIRNHPAMDAAAAGARKRESGDVWYWARKDTNTDVTPIVAASIARWAAVGPSAYEHQGMSVIG